MKKEKIPIAAKKRSFNSDIILEWIIGIIFSIGVIVSVTFLYLACLEL